ncbi:MAG: ABC transporter substrate-binding protein [Clostridia bacterium]|nr:ABC transporter substrate-binding protein [Clostridia bacterium]
MKRILSVILVLVLTLTLFASCNTTNTTDNNGTTTQATTTAQRTKVNIGFLKGPTGMGAVGLLKNNDDNKTENQYNATVLGAPDAITAKVIKGELDIAAVPTNLAAVLFNKDDVDVQIAALNTLGVLYIIEIGDTIKTINDLSGKTIYATGKGSTPEYALNYILKANGLNDVKVEYKSEHAELATLMNQGEVVIGMLPEPNVTSVLLNNKNARIALNLTEEWEKATKKNGIENSVLSMGCVIVNTEFAKNNKKAVDTFLAEYKASIDYVNNNVEAAAALCETYGIIPKAPVAKKAIPNCNICYIDGADMKAQIKDYYQVLFDANPKSVGGKLPDDTFYYSK